MSSEQEPKNQKRKLFDDATLSDVTVKFSGQTMPAHKCILARKCEYFYKAFTGAFPVAQSNEVDLGDEDCPDAVRAMIRHLYDLPYNQLIDDEDADNNTTNDDLLFHIKVFTVADKYDVPTLRELVVKIFEGLMETSREGPQFAPAMKAVCLPSAPTLADISLQKAAAKFCSGRILDLAKQNSFKAVLQEEEPFAGRLLLDVLANAPTYTCPQSILLECNHCGRLCTSDVDQTTFDPCSDPNCDHDGSIPKRGPKRGHFSSGHACDLESCYTLIGKILP